MTGNAPRRGDLILMGRVTAGIALLSRTGVGEVEIAFDEDPVRWWCGGNWAGTRKFSERFPYPAQAVEDLVSSVVNGGQCGRCERTTVVGIELEGHCSFALMATDIDDPKTYVWLRSCERALAEGADDGN